MHRGPLQNTMFNEYIENEVSAYRHSDVNNEKWSQKRKILNDADRNKS